MTAPLPDAEAVAYLKHLYDLEEGGERTTLVIGPWTAFVLIGGLQLATRHPGMSPTQKATLDDFIAQAATWFTGTPGEALIRAGNDPGQDAPTRRRR